MRDIKVVVQFKDKTIKKGLTGDFLPNKKSFHLQVDNGKTIEIVTEDLKAIFFVKDFEGDKGYREKYNEVIPGGGKKMQVEFSDGEVMVGFSQGYSSERPGFFLVPADTHSNNQRVFILRSATKRVKYL
jgi:hypothetical protein